ncbi:DUF429 domain-containing protein [Streptomonospora alba]|uniref:DUF429 domain-containing protein n=1 Tax=Streptomonospora alba TaxID=183763 RepID=UPI00069B3895|nr:DUF429 domain-containing protein [Streptomonospora alba]
MGTSTLRPVAELVVGLLPTVVLVVGALAMWRIRQSRPASGAVATSAADALAVFALLPMYSVTLAAPGAHGGLVLVPFSDMFATGLSATALYQSGGNILLFMPLGAAPSGPRGALIFAGIEDGPMPLSGGKMGGEAIRAGRGQDAHRRYRPGCSGSHHRGMRDRLGRGGAHVGTARSGCGDDDLLALLSGLAKGDRAGVDCPFGWPVAFAHAVAAHMAAAPWPGRGQDRAAHYASLRLRRTDTYAGRSTLSVSFDKLGATAARWAHLADALAARGHSVDRAGAGSVVEVYPAASRHRWGLGAQRSMANVLEAAPYLRCSSPVYEVCHGNEHAFDALIAALTARATSCGYTTAPAAAEAELAAREGWIHLPEPGSLPRLHSQALP